MLDENGDVSNANARQFAKNYPNNYETDHVGNSDTAKGHDGTRIHASEISQRGAEAGRYVIHYHARDFGAGQASGQYNTECVPMTRTVIVKDNIFDVTKNYKNWQAEVGTNNMNGWTMGSIAVAVAGVALLAFRQKRAVVTVDV